jgi:cytochrome d ubiquinol oxidase subunit II
MTDEAWVYSAAAFVVLGLMAYAVFAGADFGGGVWNLFAFGTRKDEQRAAIKHAMGPVWEANHVWLIFVIVVLFTCFPTGFSALTTALFVPLHLALLGIMLRGAAFVFRGYKRKRATLPGEQFHEPVWSGVFGASSLISPFLLGACFGSMTAGDIQVDRGIVRLAHAVPWLTPYAIGCGLLAVCACGFLAAVYLCTETSGELREDFRKRALIGGTATAVMAIAVIVLAAREATWFFQRLLSSPALPVVIGGLVFFGLSAWAVFTRRFRLARISAAGEIVLMMAGWALAHQPYMVYPDLLLMKVAGPVATIQFMVIAILAGLVLLVPSLVLLFRVFFENSGQEAAR